MIINYETFHLMVTKWDVTIVTFYFIISSKYLTSRVSDSMHKSIIEYIVILSESFIMCCLPIKMFDYFSVNKFYIVKF